MTMPENPSHSRSPATHPCFQTCGGGSAANRKRNDTRMPLFLNSRRSHIILRRPSLNPLTLQNPFVFHHLPANRTYRFGSGASIGRMETSPAMTRATFSPVSTRLSSPQAPCQSPVSVRSRTPSPAPPEWQLGDPYGKHRSPLPRKRWHFHGRAPGIRFSSSPY